MTVSRWRIDINTTAIGTSRSLWYTLGSLQSRIYREQCLSRQHETTHASKKRCRNISHTCSFVHIDHETNLLKSAAIFVLYTRCYDVSVPNNCLFLGEVNWDLFFALNVLVSFCDVLPYIITSSVSPRNISWRIKPFHSYCITSARVCKSAVSAWVE